jgi:hypothetical protein
MNSLIRPTVEVTRSFSSCVWIESAEHQWHVQVYLRGFQGLWFRRATYRGVRPKLETLFFDTYQGGIFSARPFLAGSRCDASTDLCTLALVADLCRLRNRDPAELIRLAAPSRPPYTREDLLEARRQADWERTLFPVQWLRSQTEALCLTVDHESWGDLARRLRELPA